MQVLVFCCSHASQVKQHVESSKWSSQRSADVKVQSASPTDHLVGAAHALPLVSDDAVICCCQ